MALPVDTERVPRRASDSVARLTARTWPTGIPGLAGAAALVVLLARPALVSGQHPRDWWQHLWLVSHQAESLRANRAPSLFLHNQNGVFDAIYAFYGGTLYAAAGALALLLGSAKAAFDTFVLLAFASAYGGWYWLGRIARLGRWTAHVPGVLFITSPYYLTMTYRTGAWPELIAVSTIPLILASALSVLRDERLRPWPALTLAITTILFTGSHNITLLWGSTVLVLVVAAIAVCVPEARRQVDARRLPALLAVMAPAVLVNAWFLLPDAAYHSRTLISLFPVEPNLAWAAPMLAAKYLLSPGRAPSPPRWFVLELPMVTLGWIAAGLVLAGRAGWRTAWFRVALILLVAAGLLTLLMTDAHLIARLPGPLLEIQFGYRFESYILLSVSAAAIAVLRLARAPWRWAVVGVVALTLVQAIGQQHVSHALGDDTTGDVDVARPYLTAAVYPSELDYLGARPPALSDPPHRVTFAVADAQHGRASVSTGAAPGQAVLTNAIVVPELVTFDGAHIVGRSATGGAILAVDGDSGTIAIHAANPWPVALGRILSLMGLLGLLLNAILIARARRRR